MSFLEQVKGVLKNLIERKKMKTKSQSVLSPIESEYNSPCLHIVPPDITNVNFFFHKWALIKYIIFSH